ncbi:hypothetical protein N9167_02160 [Akkermansiaceae bacterium]|nr:hypothetical protein [Akkermansiaceae bacterium]
MNEDSGKALAIESKNIVYTLTDFWHLPTPHLRKADGAASGKGANHSALPAIAHRAPLVSSENDEVPAQK